MEYIVKINHIDKYLNKFLLFIYLFQNKTKILLLNIKYKHILNLYNLEFIKGHLYK